jgi:hypothetical protein
VINLKQAFAREFDLGHDFSNKKLLKPISKLLRLPMLRSPLKGVLWKKELKLRGHEVTDYV